MLELRPAARSPRGSRFPRLALALSFAAALLPVPGQSAVAFTNAFRPESCTWSAQGRQNPFFNLRPGFQLILEGDDAGERIHLEIKVLDRLETVSFRTGGGTQLTVAARVVEERESKDGELVEVSRNFYARCVETSDIYYFGEEVDFYESGAIIGHGGSWRAGANGAQPGIIMPGTFLLGARYYQEVAPGVAEDRAEHTAMGVSLDAPAGALSGCVSTEETTALEPGARGHKTYCPRLGLVQDGALELVASGVVP